MKERPILFSADGTGDSGRAKDDDAAGEKRQRRRMVDSWNVGQWMKELRRLHLATGLGAGATYPSMIDVSLVTPMVSRENGVTF